MLATRNDDVVGTNRATGCDRRPLVGMIGAPHEEVAALREHGLDQLIEDVIDGVTNDARVEHERVAVGFLQATDVAHGPDTVGARFDDGHCDAPFTIDEHCGPRGSDPTDRRGWGRPGVHNPGAAPPGAHRHVIPLVFSRGCARARGERRG